MIRIDTQGSTYLFDEAGRYLRMPRAERERDNGEQFMQALSGGPMDDNRWNPVVSVEFRRHPHPDWNDGTYNDSLGIIYPQADLDRYPEGLGLGITTTPITDGTLDAARKLVAHGVG